MSKSNKPADSGDKSSNKASITPDTGNTASEMPSGTNPKPMDDPGAAPGRYDPNQATGSDMPLPAENAGATRNEPGTPGATVGGKQQAGPYSGQEPDTLKPTAESSRKFSHVPSRPASGSGASIGDILSLSKRFIAAVRSRNVSEMTRALGEALTMFAGGFDGGVVFQTVNPQEVDAAINEFDSLKGEVPQYVKEFANPQYHMAGGAATGAAPGMAALPRTAGMGPGEIMALIEVFGNLLAWFRNRNRGQ